MWLESRQCAVTDAAEPRRRRSRAFVTFGLVSLIGGLMGLGFALRRSLGTDMPNYRSDRAAPSTRSKPTSRPEHEPAYNNRLFVAQAAERSIDDWRTLLARARTRLEVLKLYAELDELAPQPSELLIVELLRGTRSSAERRVLTQYIAGQQLHPSLFKILIDVARTSDGPPRVHALTVLGNLTFTDLTSNPSELSYLAEKLKDLSTDECLAEAARDFAGRLRSTAPHARGLLLDRGFALTMRTSALRTPAVMSVFRAEELSELVMEWTKSVDLNARDLSIAHAWIRAGNPDADFVRRHYLPTIQSASTATEPELRRATLAIATEGARWAVEPLVSAYVGSASDTKKRLLSSALDTILGEPWLTWCRAHRAELSDDVKALSLPMRHPWEPAKDPR